MTDPGLEQAVRDAATAAGFRPDRLDLISRLLPASSLSRTADGRLDSYAIEVAVRGITHQVPEWLTPPSATPTSGAPDGNGSSDATDLIRLMHQAVGITAPGATR